MQLITLENDYPILVPEVRLIKEFNALIVRDRGSKGDTQARKKKQATKELAFIYFYVDYKSSYLLYPDREVNPDDDVRLEKLKKDLELGDDFVIDALIEAAITKYKELTFTRSMRALESARIGFQGMEDAIRSVNMSFLKPSELKAYASLIADWGKSLDGLDALEERVKKEQNDSRARVKGGGDVGDFEDPD